MITPTKEFWKIFKETNGALSCAEALAIMNIAARVPKGNYVELGTYRGKSALSAIQTLPDGAFSLVDPEFVGKELSREVLDKMFANRVNIVHCGVSSMVSVEYIPKIDTQEMPVIKKYSYCFIDSGSHQDGLPMQEVRLLEDRMIEGGVIAFHDYKNQFTEVEEAYNYLLSTGKYEEINIDWQEIFDYVAEHNLEDGNNSWHLYPELPHPPNFIGALRRK